MTTTVISTVVNSSFTFLAAGDTLIIDSLGALVTQSNAVRSGLTNLSVFVNGVIDGESNLLILSGGGANIAIGGKVGFTTNGTFTTVNAISILGMNSKITNNGEINATDTAVLLGGSQETLSNHGTINGTVRISGTGSSIVNDGTINGLISVTSGVGSTFTLTNDNIIQKNASGISYISTNGATDNLTNHGKITGEIHLGAGDDVFDTRTGLVDAFVDGGAGNDTFFVDSEINIHEAAGEGIDTVFSAISLSLDSQTLAQQEIENLTLLGIANINATGNILDNKLTGNDGDNVLDGGLGNDTLTGGLGDDTYIVTAGDTIVEAAAGGSDTVHADFTFTLADNLENLVLLGLNDIDATGNDVANIITGNEGNNVLNGGNGDDKLNGAAGNDLLIGGAGDDILTGGSGNDTYIVTAGDTIVEKAADGGTDTVQADFSFTLTDNIEKLILLGASDIDGTGNDSNNVLNGNIGHNVLNGGAGDDQLNGDAGNDTLIGGTGLDTLAGGSGDDTYVVTSGDATVEFAESGTDTVQADFTFSLAANFENLVLLGANDIDGTGNELRNKITGNSGDNVLDGGAGDDELVGAGGDDQLIGGDGNDILTGGQGNDFYIVSAGDTTIETAANGGIDTVQADTSFTLSDNVENLILSGTNDIDGTGNGGNNILNGNSGRNVLNGGAGIDTLAGGGGDDTYILTAGDTIIELAGDGIDTVQASFSLALAVNIEKLLLTGSLALNGIGNSSNNTLIGNDGANTLCGGAGNDILNGGKSNDKLYGDDEADTLVGGDGNDVLNGGTSIDRLYGGNGNDIYEMGVGDVIGEIRTGGVDTVKAGFNYTLAANVENLILTGGSSINGTGNGLNNVITGNGGANILHGGSGNDRLNGGKGNDKVYGDYGIDTLIGGDGKDLLVGGRGNDKLYGGASADTFVFKRGDGVDHVADFGNGADKIDIRDLSHITSFDDLIKHHASYKSGDVIIADGSQKIILDDTRLSDLHAANFMI